MNGNEPLSTEKRMVDSLTLLLEKCVEELTKQLKWLKKSLENLILRRWGEGLQRTQNVEKQIEEQSEGSKRWRGGLLPVDY